MRLIIHLCKHL